MTFGPSYNIGRKLDDFPDSKRRRLRPGKVSPPRLVPKHIQRPPYVKSKTPPGIASGPEVHDEQGIECMRASGRLAAQVLQYAGTLVKVSSFIFITCQPFIITLYICYAIYAQI